MSVPSLHIESTDSMICSLQLKCTLFFVSAEPIVVGYEFSEYTTSESIGFVELCAGVTSHSAGAPRPFVISATTANGSASMQDMICRVKFFNCPLAASTMDYRAIVAENLIFSLGQRLVCHMVQIIQDNICEMVPEEFFFNLQYESGIMPIIINPNQIRVLIDDANEPECGKWAT